MVRKMGRNVFLVTFLMLASSYLLAYDNSPSNYQIVPECIWAPATGGGIWYTEIQIYDRTGGSEVRVYFDYGGGFWTGPFLIWTSPGAHHLYLTSSILQTIDYWDTSSFVYYGRVGAVEFYTQDASHLIQVYARTWHSGGYGKTFPGLNKNVESNSAAVGRPMLLLDVYQTSSYRFFMGAFNCTSGSLTVEVRILGPDNNILGSFTETFAPYDFKSFNPFTKAGLSGTYTNCFIWINPTSGTGAIMLFGASAHNTTNDPASHIATQYN